MTEIEQKNEDDHFNTMIQWLDIQDMKNGSRGRGVQEWLRSIQSELKELREENEDLKVQRQRLEQ